MAEEIEDIEDNIDFCDYPDYGRIHHIKIAEEIEDIEDNIDFCDYKDYGQTHPIKNKKIINLLQFISRTQKSGNETKMKQPIKTPIKSSFLDKRKRNKTPKLGNIICVYENADNDQYIDLSHSVLIQNLHLMIEQQIQHLEKVK